MINLQNLQFPRQQNIMKNINVLLNSQRVRSPEKHFHEKFFSSHSKPKSAQRIKYNLQNNAKESKRPSTQGYSSLRTLIKNPQLDPLVSIGQRKEKLKPTLTMQNLRKTFRNSKKITSSKTLHRKQKPEFNLQVKINSAQLASRSELKGQRNTKYNSTSPKKLNQEELFDFQPKYISRKKEFLKKGTNISKQILSNIFKKKLPNNQIDPQHYIRNEQILRMLKVYKGTELITKKEEVSDPEQMVGKATHEIEGWENITLQFQQL